MGSQKCGIVGKSQSVLIMINPIIFTRTRTVRGGNDDLVRARTAAVSGQHMAGDGLGADGARRLDMQAVIDASAALPMPAVAPSERERGLTDTGSAGLSPASPPRRSASDVELSTGCASH